jgi:hypothetical protein
MLPANGATPAAQLSGWVHVNSTPNLSIAQWDSACAAERMGARELNSVPEQCAAGYCLRSRVSRCT